jgi:hypothetical protein
VSARAAPDQRARLIAAIFIVCYLAFSVPVVVAGVAVTHVGLHLTALVYCASPCSSRWQRAVWSPARARHMRWPPSTGGRHPCETGRPALRHIRDCQAHPKK